MKIFWVIVSGNNLKEANKISQVILKKRLAACAEIYPRTGAWFFWPPQKNRIDFAKGCLLTLITLPGYYQSLERAVKKIHSDKVPLIAGLEFKKLNKQYQNWLKIELRN
jgi:periplasmic divalent cation tolerance protein